LPSNQARTPVIDQSPRSLRPVSALREEEAEDLDDLRQRMEEQNKIGSVEVKQSLFAKLCKPCYNLKNKKELIKSATFKEHVNAG